MKTRSENDSMGQVDVPVDVLYQAQTQRARQNFHFSPRRFPDEIISAIIDIKDHGAQVNAILGELDTPTANAISNTASQAKQLEYAHHFPLDVFQTGSGTSSNMNVNEVLASLASAALGKSVHPNDHVNRGQSSNDVVPSAIQISCVRLLNSQLFPAISGLATQLNILAHQYANQPKTGRTHLMDAMPITLGQEFRCWHGQLANASRQLHYQAEQLTTLPLGGTAVGSGVNTHPEFATRVCARLALADNIPWAAAADPAIYMSAQDHSLALAGGLKTLAVALLKIANDLRWMNSGPIAGLQEIQLSALQPGSSIMPGKVNPVIPEAVAMIAADVIGNESTITIAAQSGNFQLNVMLPLIGEKLLASIHLLSNACTSLVEHVFSDISPNKAGLEKALVRNPILATALNQAIGYEKAAVIAKRAAKENRSVLEIALEETTLDEEKLRELLDPIHLALPYGLRG